MTSPAPPLSSSMYFLHLRNSEPPHRANSGDTPSGNLSESQQPAITCHLSPWGATQWPPCQSQASKMWDEKAFDTDTHILTVDLSDPTLLHRVTTRALTVHSAVMYWWVSGYRGLNKSHEAVLLCLALFFPVCSVSDRKTAKNHGLSQLEKKKNSTVATGWIWVLHDKQARR